MKSVLYLIFVIWGMNGFPIREKRALGLGVDFHLSLQKGSQLGSQDGVYLQDSFRRDVVIPLANNVFKELQKLETVTKGLIFSDTISQVAMAGGLLVCMIILYFLKNKLNGVILKMGRIVKHEDVTGF